MLSDNPKLTLRKRRWMVAAYYFAAVLLAAVAVYALHFRHVSVFLLGAYFPLLLSFIIVLGGLRLGGPVRPFSRRVGSDATQPLIQLRLSGRKSGENVLDERDIAVRDHAHYVAMCMLRFATWIFAMVVWAFAVFHRIAWLPITAGVGAFLLFVAAMSLPQAILLWTEPDPASESPAQLTGAAQ